LEGFLKPEKSMVSLKSASGRDCEKLGTKDSSFLLN
jgi:hypothetical protein